MTEPSFDGYPTALGVSDETTISLLGHDLADDIMGKVGFGELALWLMLRRRPSAGQTRVFEAVLAGLADHGFVPIAIAARLTYYGAPESLQGAIAAGLLGGGSRFLGVTEDSGRFLASSLEGLEPLPVTEEQWDAVARDVITVERDAGRMIPGLGHATHTSDPRVPRLIAIAEEEGLRGPHLKLMEALGRVHPGLLGRTLPVNGAGASGAALADAGVPLAMLRGVALLARTAGLLGQLAEEREHPIARDVYLSVHDRTRSLPPDA